MTDQKEKEQRARQEGTWTRPAYPEHQLCPMCPQGQSHQEVRHGEHRRGSCCSGHLRGQRVWLWVSSLFVCCNVHFCTRADVRNAFSLCKRARLGFTKLIINEFCLAPHESILLVWRRSDVMLLVMERNVCYTLLLSSQVFCPHVAYTVRFCYMKNALAFGFLTTNMLCPVK